MKSSKRPLSSLYLSALMPAQGLSNSTLRVLSRRRTDVVMVSTTESSLSAIVTLSQSLSNARSLGGSLTVPTAQYRRIVATGSFRTHGAQDGAIKDSCEYRSQMAVESAE